jgi:hypothetical protein
VRDRYLALRVVGSLVAAEGLIEGRRAAHVDEHVLRGAGDVLLDDVGVDEAGVALPRRAVGGLGHDVVDLEVRVLLGELVETVLEDDVLLGVVGKDERDVGVIVLLAENLLEHLEHGRDA